MPLSPQHSNHRLWILRLGSPFLRSTSPSEQKDHKNDGDAPHLVLWVTLFIFILKQVYKQWFYKQWFNVGDAISFFQHCRTDCHPRPGLWFQILFTLILFSFFWTQTMICILGTIDQMFMHLWIVVLNSRLWFWSQFSLFNHYAWWISCTNQDAALLRCFQLTNSSKSIAEGGSEGFWSLKGWGI